MARRSTTGAMVSAVLAMILLTGAFGVRGAGAQESMGMMGMEGMGATDARAGAAGSARQAGAYALPTGWWIDPAGRSVEAGSYPVRVVASPAGNVVAVAHVGTGTNEVRLLDVASGEWLDRVELEKLGGGMAFSNDGARFAAVGGNDDTLWVWEVLGDRLARPRSISLKTSTPPPPPQKGRKAAAKPTQPVGGYAVEVAAGAESDVFYAAMLSSDRIVKVRLAATGDADADVQLFGIFENSQSVPAALAVDRSRRKLYAALWNADAVAEFDLDTTGPATRPRRMLPTLPRPRALALDEARGRLFVSCGGDSRVEEIDLRTGKAAAPALSVAFDEKDVSLFGWKPAGLSVDAEGKTLAVAASGVNAVALFDVSRAGAGKRLGFVPAEWRPLDVTWAGGALAVVNALGPGSGPNPTGPRPDKQRRGDQEPEVQISEFLTGSVQLVARPTAPELEQFDRVVRGGKPRPAAGEMRRVGELPAPPKDVRRVVLILRENRSYDSILGDVEQADGHTTLCIFGQALTPNAHALAREFVHFDRYLVGAQSDCEGQMLALAGTSSDYVDRFTFTRDQASGPLGLFEGRYAIVDPPTGYLWDRLKTAGLSCHSFGAWANGGSGRDKARPRVKSLQGFIEADYPASDTEITDRVRAQKVLDRIDEWSDDATMPALVMVRLPGGRGLNTGRGKRAIRTVIAETDSATGMIVEKLSRSKFWESTVVIVVETDSEQGADHRDAHRSLLFIASPWTRRGGQVLSTPYTTADVARTVGWLLGIEPASLTEQAARPIVEAFAAEADPRPFTARSPEVDWDARN